MSELGTIDLIWSEVLDYEVANNPDSEIADAIMDLSKKCKEFAILNDQIASRAAALALQGLRMYDALHVACAEQSGVDIFLTVDDSLLNRLSKVSSPVQHLNPLNYLVKN